MWDHLTPARLVDPHNTGPMTTGTRVARVGTVSFVRSGFARVRWDDGRVSDEWAADLIADASRETQSRTEDQ